MTNVEALREDRPALAARGPAVRLDETEALALAAFVAALAASGVPLEGALKAAAKDLPTPRLARACTALALELERNPSFDAAVEALGPQLPPHVRELLASGAQAGQLAVTLEALLAHERVVSDLTLRFRQALAYPVILLTFVVAWLLGASLWLVPYGELNLNEGLISDVFYLGSRAPYRFVVPNLARSLALFPRVLLLVGGVTVAVVAAARLLGGKALVSRLAMSVPLAGTAWWYRGLADFSGLLALFLRRELPLAEALRLVARSARDPAIRAKCESAAVEVAAGRALGQCLGETALFPATLVNFVAWGERQGTLADTLASVRDMCCDRFEHELRLVRLIIPPIVFLIAAAAALLVLAVIFGPMLSLIKLIVDLS